MGLRIGRYNFTHVTYDESSDVIYATRDATPTARRQPTPEEHVLLFDAEDRFHGVALMEPRERLSREGRVSLTLPTGEHERVVGVEFAVRQRS